MTGLVGSGYDEIPYLIYGARPARDGTLDLAGRGANLSEWTPQDAIRSGVVLVPADRANSGVIGPPAGHRHVTMPTLGSRFKRWMLNRRAMSADAAEMTRRFEVRPADPSMPMASLSGGNQQKVVLAKWFQMEPKLILLDEPTQGVDVGARETVFRHIANAAAAGAAVLCASSDYEQLAAICSRVLIFAAGRVVATLRRRGDLQGSHRRAQPCRSPPYDWRQGPLAMTQEARAETAARTRGVSHKQILYRFEQFGLSSYGCCLSALFSYLRPDTFLTWPNFSTILGSQAVLVVVTLGLIIPLTANDFDMSIAFVMTLSSMLVPSSTSTTTSASAGRCWRALALGIGVGVINGLLITVFRIHSLIVTLGTGTFLHGFTLWLSDSMTISGISPALMNAVIVDRLFGVPLEFYYAIGLAAIVWYLLEYTALGRRILFVGAGARLQG